MSRVTSLVPAAAGLALLLVASTADAAMPEGPPPPLGYAWTLSLWTLLPLAAAAIVYTAGVVRMRRAPAGTGISGGWHGPLAFAAGLLALGFALVWPLDTFAAYALSAHVAQHMTLLAWAPPLLLIARPGAVAAHALPRAVASRLARVLGPVGRLAHAQLGAATLVHVGTMWLWHLPAATSATLASEPLHRTMLASVLLAGLWFWSAVLYRLRTRDGGATGALVSLVTAMMLMGFLGALLTFSPRLLYPAYTDRALLAGLDALGDQQLAGLLMWVPSGLPYLVVGMCLVVALLRSVQRSAADGPSA
ncbi:cytochrome c oxidase assembly protein [Luteimonas fraxinea]|uniref:Cytochrome c oxidase assembly protein n=1 Tax=Luteimonas fraxinea TaxID=2901869 RepID=A0ABS8UFS9_9GAMM|nr:cytochrome c oxidase assembly protein [Luteimonas fraxinea]MCD9098338.1 cytochrome c oxidase assembly protein [Luteimonas fraxinea]MCD9127070.1 cytochrome c oxidase assembly protein [Luteimonas fraxinea]UHH08728.1 cytochrome c oxidase assembly protein [Luteimonas fraxinea]